MKNFFLLTIIISWITVDLFPNSKITIAVLDFEIIDNSMEVKFGNAMRQLLVIQLLQSPEITVLEKEQIAVINQLSNPGHVIDQSNAIKVGKILGADFVVLGEIKKMLRDTVISVQLVDISKSSVVGSHNVVFNRSANLLALVKLLSEKILLDISVNYPRYPWPPPKASAFFVLPDTIFKDIRYLGDIEQKLIEALRKCGYLESSFYVISSKETTRGFALVARIEQTDQWAYPLRPPGRWQINVKLNREFSLGNIIKTLFSKNPGFFRIVVFIVVNEPFSQSNETITREMGMDLLNKGMIFLPSSIREIPFSKDYSCTALIYEFEISESGIGAVQLLPSAHPGQIHLERSELLKALGE